MLVGIEIAHNGQVNRANIVQDFKSRHLSEPTAIIRGDAMDERIRDDARTAVGNEPFDCIITGENVNCCISGYGYECMNAYL